MVNMCSKVAAAMIACVGLLASSANASVTNHVSTLDSNHVINSNLLLQESRGSYVLKEEIK